ncbi:MAG: alpha/beta hydrolase, partial [Clostridia bacterium]|nr:alpha/beta hydrolase [Clostridia bacterium]
MKKTIYIRGKLGTVWYNFTETLAYIILHRKTPESCIYTPKVKYGKGRQQFLNLCTRRDLEGEKKPLFIYIHGGGWVSGITNVRDTYIANWAEKGFFTASIAYTYAPDLVYPGQLQEICDAIDFIYDHAEEWGADTKRVVLAGESAGGYYIMFAAALAADPSLADKLHLTFRHRDEFHVDAMVSNCGCFNIKSLIDPDKKQSKFPDMKMMVTSFLGMSRDKCIEYLKTEEGSLTYPHFSENFPPAFFTTACNDWLRYEGYDMMKEYDSLGIPYDT